MLSREFMVLVVAHFLISRCSCSQLKNRRKISGRELCEFLPSECPPILDTTPTLGECNAEVKASGKRGLRFYTCEQIAERFPLTANGKLPEFPGAPCFSRAADGTLNDLNNDLTSSQYMPYRRVTPHVDTGDQPNPRAISNVVNFEFPGTPDALSTELNGESCQVLPTPS